MGPSTNGRGLTWISSSISRSILAGIPNRAWKCITGAGSSRPSMPNLLLSLNGIWMLQILTYISGGDWGRGVYLNERGGLGFVSLTNNDLSRIARQLIIQWIIHWCTDHDTRPCTFWYCVKTFRWVHPRTCLYGSKHILTGHVTTCYQIKSDGSATEDFKTLGLGLT